MNSSAFKLPYLFVIFVLHKIIFLIFKGKNDFFLFYSQNDKKLNKTIEYKK